METTVITQAQVTCVENGWQTSPESLLTAKTEGEMADIICSDVADPCDELQKDTVAI